MLLDQLLLFRLAGLKILFPQGSVGSTPTAGIFLLTPRLPALAAACQDGSEETIPLPMHDDRRYWVGVAERLATPVLENLAARRLKTAMPVEPAPGAVGSRAFFSP